MAKINIRNRNKGKYYKNGKPKSPNWEYRFEAAPINGHRQQISQAGFRTKKEAEEAGAAALAEYDNAGQTFIPSELSFSDYLDYWIEEYCITNLKESTVSSYKKKIRLYIKPVLGTYRLKSLSSSVLQNFINDKFNEGFSRNTLTCLKGMLTGSLDYAVEPCQFIRQNPAVFVKLPLKRAVPNVPTREKKKRPVTKDEWRQIMQRFPEGTSAHIPLVLAYHCGLRLGEVFGLAWSDIDFENQTLSVNRQVQESDSNRWKFTPPKYDSYRTISVDKKTMNLLQREKERQLHFKKVYDEYYTELYNENNYLTTSENENPIDLIMRRENGEYIQPRIIQHVGRVIHGKDKKNAVPISTDWDFHSLRHTHITTLSEAGVPLPLIQQRAGHTKIEMTEKYTHVTDSMEKNFKKQLALLYG